MITVFDKFDNKETFKNLEDFRNDQSYRKTAKIIKIENLKITNANYLFQSFDNLECVIFEKNVFEDCMSFVKMFDNCHNLNCEIIINAKNARKIDYMFSNCLNLDSKITLENLDNLKSAEGVFYNCPKFNKKLDFDINYMKLDFKGKFFYNNKDMSFENRIHNFNTIGVSPKKLKDLLFRKAKKDLFNNI